MDAPIPDEQAALLSAIVAEPDDDAPRLVYADWLQEHGDEEQAQFIRDWVALEWLEDYEDEKRQGIAKRLDGAAGQNGLRWVEAVGVAEADVVYDRGMVESVLYRDLRAFLAEAPALFARVPVRSVAIHGVGRFGLDPDALVHLAAMPELGRLRALRLSNHGWAIASAAWEQFITSPALANLETLAVEELGLGDGDMDWFDRCDRLTHLEELGLAGNRITATGALRVVRSARLPNLKRLGLAGNNIAVDRRRGSAYLALRDALFDRFDSATALESIV